MVILTFSLFHFKTKDQGDGGSPLLVERLAALWCWICCKEYFLEYGVNARAYSLPVPLYFSHLIVGKLASTKASMFSPVN